MGPTAAAVRSVLMLDSIGPRWVMSIHDGRRLRSLPCSGYLPVLPEKLQSCRTVRRVNFAVADAKASAPGCKPSLHHANHSAKGYGGDALP